MENVAQSHHKKSIPSLTGLRFFAAFFVFMSHALLLGMPMQGQTPYWYIQLSTLAAEGMSLFFVLSGFVIQYNYSASIRKNAPLGIYNFFIARFARLYPLFLVGLSFDLVHHYGYAQITPFFWHVIPYFLTLTQSWFYIPFGHNSMIYQFGHVPTLGWSISTECFFYLVYPIVCFGLIKTPTMQKKILAYFTVIVISLAAIAFLWHNEAWINHFGTTIFGPIADKKNGFQDCFYRWLIYFSPYSRVSEFLLGCVTAAIYMQIQHISPTAKENLFGVILMIFTLIGTLMFHYLAFSQSAKVNSLPFIGYIRNLAFCFGLAPFASCFIFCCARYQNHISRFFTYPMFLIGGEASYSFYLFHTVVLEAFSRDAATVSMGMSKFVFLADISRLVLAFCAAMGLGIIFYNVIEVPSRRIIRKTLTIKDKKISIILPIKPEINMS